MLQDLTRADANLTAPLQDEDALVALLAALDRAGYQFVTTTPATHARILARPDMRRARDVRGVFGWSLPFEEGVLEPEIAAAARAAGALIETPEGLKSRVRASRVQGRLFLHSAYPTQDKDSVFLGPDSQKLADFAVREVEAGPPVRHVVDLGAGAGVGGILAGLAAKGARVTLTDINPAALPLARANARFAGLKAEAVLSDVFTGVEGEVDLALANPPFMADDAHRTYRDGGGDLGEGLPVDWALKSAERLVPGGRFLLYSGAAVVEGRDGLRAALERQLPADCVLRYREVDPDIFGEELEQGRYAKAGVERIAAIEAVVTKQAR